MSYSIYYRKVFIKIDAPNLLIGSPQVRYIPMIEAGSSNCYESTHGGGSQRRARDWQLDSYILKNQSLPWLTETGIYERLTEIRNEAIERQNLYIAEEKERIAKGETIQYPTTPYEDKAYGWLSSFALSGYDCGSTTFGMFRNFYKTGITYAKSIEELREYDIYTRIQFGWYTKQSREKNNLPVKEAVLLGTTEDLVREVYEWWNFCGKQREFTFAFRGERGIELMLEQQKAQRTKHRKQGVEVNNFFALKVKDVDGYLVKLTRNGYRYCELATAYSTQKFFTQKEAEQRLKKMRNPDAFEVVPVNYQTTIYR